MKLLTESANAGNADAQFNLAVCYYSGEGTAQDFKKAAEWMTKAAKQGHADAQKNLGFCYELIGNNACAGFACAL